VYGVRRTFRAKTECEREGYSHCQDPGYGSRDHHQTRKHCVTKASGKLIAKVGLPRCCHKANLRPEETTSDGRKLLAYTHHWREDFSPVQVYCTVERGLGDFSLSKDPPFASVVTTSLIRILISRT